MYPKYVTSREKIIKGVGGVNGLCFVYYRHGLLEKHGLSILFDVELAEASFASNTVFFGTFYVTSKCIKIVPLTLYFVIRHCNELLLQNLERRKLRKFCNRYI